LFASLVLFIAAVKKGNALEDVALVAGTSQNLSNLYSLDIYGFNPISQIWWVSCSIFTRIQYHSIHLDMVL